jgi:hypothetical protein
MEITKTNESTSVEAKVTIGNVDYTFNYSIKESKIISFNGSANIEGVNKGNFNVSNNPGIENNINFNFNFTSNTEVLIRSTIVIDVDTIFSELNK